MYRLRYHHLLICLIFLAIGAMDAVVLASANVSISFSSTMSIPPNSLVSTIGGSPNSVELANSDNAQHLIGVAVSTNQSLLSINASNNTQVAVSGVVEASVATINGDIHVGDQIAASPIDGVGMKAGSGMKAIGIAQTELTSATKGTATLDIKDKSGNTVRIYLGHVTISIASSNFSATQQNAPSFLGSVTNVASTVSGHSVSSLQALFGLVVALVAIIITVVLVYATIRGGIISLGRNPLAKTHIFHSIEEVMALIPAVVVIAGIIIYFILR